MEQTLKLLQSLHSEIIQRSKLLWPAQGDRAKGLGFTKQRLDELEKNNGEAYQKAKLPTLIKVVSAIAKEQQSRISVVPNLDKKSEAN